MKTFRACLTTLLALCLILPLLTACTGGGSGSSTGGAAPEVSGQTSPSAEGAQLLTGIFSETSCQLSEAARVYRNVIPLYDRDSGKITEFVLEWEEVTGEDDVIESVFTGWLYTVSDAGELLDKEEIPLPDAFGSLHSGAVLPDAVIYSCSSQIEDTMVWRYDRTTGETISSGSIEELIGNRNFSPTAYAVDAEGRMYGTDKNTVFVLNPDLTLAFVYDFPATIYTMSRGADGAVWVTFNAGMESCAATIDPETRKLGTYHAFTRGMDGANKPLHYLLASAMNAGESAYNFFYYDLSGFLWGVTVTEEGTLAETQIFDLFNSGISQLNSSAASTSDLYPMAFLTDELFLTMKYNGQGWDNRHDSFVLYHREEDIDMSDQTVLTIAYAYPLTAAIVEHITEFKRTRPNVSIVLEDYSRYATEENSRAGEEKLCFDLVNGFVKPDIVITDARTYTLGDDMVITQLYRNNLYVDLVPYLEKDDTLNFDNLFGCIRRLFDDGKGGMWGISTDFEVGLLYGSKELLGDYADKGYWTLDELLDFFDSLSADTERLYGYTRTIHNQVNYLLTSQGYGYFLHDGRCSFDSAEFIRYLNHLKTTPSSPEDWRKTSPVADIRKLSYAQQEKAIEEAINIGKIALNNTSLSYRYMHDALFSEVTFPIGYATKNDSGFRVDADTTYIITTHAEDPDICFELIKSFFVCEEKYVGSFSFKWPLFARKDHFETTLVKQMTPTEIQLMTDEEFKAYCAERGTPYAPRAKAPTPLTDEEIAELCTMLDGMGSPIIEKTPTAVEAIVEEEISVFLSGMGTAEDCAKKIQSRVEIWLAEHE